MNQNADWYPERPPEFLEPGEFEAWIFGTDRPTALGEHSFSGFAVRPRGKIPVRIPELNIGIEKSSPDSEEHRGYLAAVVGALELVAPMSSVHFYSHHDLIVRMLNELISTWQANGWKKAAGNSPAALEICQRLWAVKKSRSLTITSERVARNDWRYNHIFNELAFRIDKTNGKR